MEPGENPKRQLGVVSRRRRVAREERDAAPLRGNNAERETIEHLMTEGWAVYTRGWPDLLVHRGGRIMAIEVKPHGRGLNRHQEVMIGLLRRAGLHVEIWETAKAGRTLRADLQQRRLSTLKGRITKMREQSDDTTP